MSDNNVANTPADIVLSKEGLRYNIQLPKSEKEKIRVAVTKGGPFLDEKYPDWKERVDPYTIVMASPVDCVLAQASGADYRQTRDGLGLSFEDSCALGFSFLSRSSNLYDALNFLKAEWIRQHLS